MGWDRRTNLNKHSDTNRTHTKDGGNGRGERGSCPHKTQGVGPPRLVTMTHNTVARQPPLLHHSIQHDQAGATVILFPNIPPVSGSTYSHNNVIRL